MMVMEFYLIEQVVYSKYRIVESPFPHRKTRPVSGS
jgi:hypothetical protein